MMIKKTKLARHIALAVLPLALLQACNSETTQSAPAEQVAPKGSYQLTEHGVVVTPSQASEQRIQLEVMADNIIHVTAVPQQQLPASNSLIVTATAQGKFSVEESAQLLTVKAKAITAKVSLTDGKVSFFNAKGEPLLSEAEREFSQVTQDPMTPDVDSYALRQQWNKNTDEAFYGLGQHQNGEVNFAGDNVELTTYNLVISIPYVMSSRNYGVLWDNTSVTRFGDPKPPTPIMESFELFDAQGNPGGLTADYYDGDKLLLSRTESDLNYQFLSNNTAREIPFPKELGDVAQPRIVWHGQIAAKNTGEHKIRMYNSGYAKLSVDGELVLDRWRMNWNPWYHDAALEFTAGEKKEISLDWDSQGGYFRLLANQPQAQEDQFSLSLASETGKSIDYYVVAGDDADELIAGYRELTGDSVMLPKWAYGFWQSRERYKNQQELVDVVKEYRKREIPIDNIVLDWSYWPVDAWGSHDFDKQHFPDPKAMIDEVHELNTNIMISVWPKFYPTTDHYKEFDAKGYMLSKNVEQEKNLDWIAPGYLNGFYDPYTEEAREIFWRQINEKLNVLGFDAWWLDAAEPDIHSNVSFMKRKEIMSPLAVGSGAEYFNSYGLVNAEGVYEGERQTDPHKRSFILTRSGFAGIQRTGSAIWSGDTVPRWSNLREQIAAGIGAGMAGMPNWTFDIGGFTPEDHYRQGKNGFVGHINEMDEEHRQPWQELNLRWFQFGAFVPLFRSHGQNPYREIYNLADEGSEAYNSMVYYTKLRYRLMPYIYSEAGKLYHHDGTLMRGLFMDFPEDLQARDVSDSYMFGPAFLVNPVHEYQATSREVYLPQGVTWYDFYTGKAFAGGQTIEADAPLSRMPLFVKAGSILPTGPAVQHVYEKLDAPITLTVYTGADGDYLLYNDDGKTYGYEKGEFTEIPLHYDDAAGTLTIGERSGAFPSMVKERQFNIRWISGASDKAADLSKFDTTVTYTGAKLVVKR